MHLKTRNVNSAFRTIVAGVKSGEIPTVATDSRAGKVLQVAEPVLVTYSNPRERVLFNSARDANPFFHLFEALWMLSGRQDVAPLAYYNSRMKDFSDDGRTFNGAYGYRWRKHFDVTDNSEEGPYIDQLDLLVKHLKENPASRRAVLQMWTVEDDLLKVDTSKDVCCNLSVMFSLREIPWEYPNERQRRHTEEVTGYVPRHVLDMTVTNRSNDAIWGLLGANYVHFSILQEYMAARLGVEVGQYHHFTNNLHFYTADGRWEPEKWLDDKGAENAAYAMTGHPGKDIPLVSSDAFDKEVGRFVDRHGEDSIATEFTEPFLQRVAQPMCVAFHHHKQRDYKAALQAAHGIAAADWQFVSVAWLTKRKETYEQGKR